MAQRLEGKSVRPSPPGIVIALLENLRDAEPRPYGSIATTQHALLRRLGYHYDGKTHWTQSHRNYLRGLKLPDAAHIREILPVLPCPELPSISAHPVAECP